jgi:hypothetical protein
MTLVESSEYCQVTIRIWHCLLGYNDLAFFDKMEPPRQDQATHQDKVRAPLFGLIRIWPWSNLVNIARLNHPNLPDLNPNMTPYIRIKRLCLFWTKWSLRGRTRLLTKTRLESPHHSGNIRIWPWSNLANIARSQSEYDTVYWDTMILLFLTKWSLPGRTRLLTKTRLEPLYSVLSEYDPGRIWWILPGWIIRICQISIRIWHLILG